jgi:two-component system response regulator HydG
LGERTEKLKEVRKKLRETRDTLYGHFGYQGAVGASEAMRRCFGLIERVKDTDVPVLITGESGTGKEVVARAIHRGSDRAKLPFLGVNCGAIPEHLLESELFGHKRGAFTDARDNRAGLLIQGRGGTVFLDEIGDMPPGMQAKLLRAIESRTVRPVGSDTEIPIDVRFIAATNRDLESDSEEGRFRHDLFFRINVIQIAVPALRARGNDILLLAQHFLARAAGRNGKAVGGFSPAAAERLLSYNWPGNVRELQNAVERAVALTAFDRVTPEDLPERIRTHRRAQLVVADEDPTSLLPMHEVERRYILHVLESAGGNKTVAARILGFDRRTMYRKLERFDRPSASRSVARSHD